MKLFLFFCCFFCFTITISATEDPISCEVGGDNPPEWTKVTAWGMDSEHHSVIKVVSGHGWDPKSAEEDAFNNVMRDLAFLTGANCKYKNGLFNCDDITNREMLFITLRGPELIRTPKIKYDGCKNYYTVYFLVQLPKDLGKKQLFDDITKKPPFSYRVFVPGMAQIYKGQNLKGALFIAGEALFIVGLATSFGVSAHYKDRYDKERNTEKRDKYGNWANAAKYTGLGFVGAAVALYIVNIIDGIEAPVGDSVLFDKKTGERIDLVLAPTATFDSVGLAMNLNF